MLPFGLHPPSLLLAVLAGLAIGFFFFGGLWLTVRHTARSATPSLLLPLSLAVRLILALAAFYLVGGRSWQNLLACVLGFVTARFVLLRTLTGHSTIKPVRGELKQDRKPIQ